ncbi:MAG: TolC family protein [Candidatus Synoicihabitans palmerolidicus]|nr:TolC family protein [Candidatus Synoicihabitans palmerolidicus]
MSRSLRPASLALILTVSAFARLSAAAPETVLTLDEAVAQALEQNFSLEIQRFSTQSADAVVDVADADYDPSFSVTARQSLNQQAQAGSTLDGVTIEGPRSDNSSLRVGRQPKDCHWSHGPSRGQPPAQQNQLPKRAAQSRLRQRHFTLRHSTPPQRLRIRRQQSCHSSRSPGSRTRRT